jgi:hypothetical protein
MSCRTLIPVMGRVQGTPARIALRTSFESRHRPCRSCDPDLLAYIVPSVVGDSIRVIGTRVLADGRLKVSRTSKSTAGLDR